MRTLYYYSESENEVVQSCLTLCDPMVCSLSGSSIHRIFQARVLDCHFLLQGIFPTQESKPGLPHRRHTLYCLSHQGRPLASLVAQRVKHLPTMRETWVRSLGQDDPLENEMATHSSTLAWKILWMEEPGRLSSMGSQRAEHD